MCENSTFCNKEIVGDALSGLKGFVVKFMIRMSRVLICDVKLWCTHYLFCFVFLYFFGFRTLLHLPFKVKLSETINPKKRRKFLKSIRLKAVDVGNKGKYLKSLSRIYMC